MKRIRHATLLIATGLLFVAFLLQQYGEAAENPEPVSIESKLDDETNVPPIDENETAIQKKLIEAVEALKNLSENRPIDGVTAVALLLMGSFIVDRFASGLIALFSLSRSWEKSFKDPTQIPLDNRRERTIARAKLVAVYYALAIVGAAGLIFLFQDIHIWKSLAFPKLTNREDQIITAIVVVVGAERIAQWFQLPGSPGAAGSQPVELSGNLTLVEPLQSEPKSD